MWSNVKYKNILVFYKEMLDGGGQDQMSKSYVSEVRRDIGPVDTICEFACGPAFIGFSLLAHGLCKNLCLVDVNPLAIKAVKKTIKENHLEAVVRVYQSDSLKSVPKTEKWDLVVSNPPHFGDKYQGHGDDLLLYDPGWRIHKNFYKSVGKHLNKNGSVFFLENELGSSAKTFKEMIKSGGLRYIRSYKCVPPRLEVLRILLKKINIANLKELFTQYGMHAARVNVTYLSNNQHFFILSRKA